MRLKPQQPLNCKGDTAVSSRRNSNKGFLSLNNTFKQNQAVDIILGISGVRVNFPKLFRPDPGKKLLTPA